MPSVSRQLPNGSQQQLTPLLVTCLLLSWHNTTGTTTTTRLPFRRGPAAGVVLPPTQPVEITGSNQSQIGAAAAFNASTSTDLLPPYHAGLVCLVVLLATVLLFLVVTMALPLSMQNFVFSICLRDTEQFSYIDVGLYKTRHAMYRKEVYSTEMRRKPRLSKKWLRGLTKKKAAAAPIATATPSSNAASGPANSSEPFQSVDKNRAPSAVRSKLTAGAGNPPNHQELVVMVNGRQESAIPSTSCSLRMEKEDIFVGRNSHDFMTSSLCSIPEESTSSPNSGSSSRNSDSRRGESQAFAAPQKKYTQFGGCSEYVSKSDSHLFYETRPEDICVACEFGLMHHCTLSPRGGGVFAGCLDDTADYFFDRSVNSSTLDSGKGGERCGRNSASSTHWDQEKQSSDE